MLIFIFNFGQPKKKRNKKQSFILSDQFGNELSERDARSIQHYIMEYALCYKLKRIHSAGPDYSTLIILDTATDYVCKWKSWFLALAPAKHFNLNGKWIFEQLEMKWKKNTHTHIRHRLWHLNKCTGVNKTKT